MQTLYFYDLETTSVNSRTGRIMQFAGQRTTMDCQPVGEPHNILIKLSADCLPDQQTWADGVTEAEFLRIFQEEIATPGTIFLGYNTVRFDDEFMRFLHWRNYYDAYEWQWSQDRGRWDMLDLVRMTRALRPDGLQWPEDAEGKPTVRLELMTKANGLDHEKAHDALSDVSACIALAKLLQDKQPKLFDYLLQIRQKSAVGALVNGGKPFVYTSGKYAGEYLKTTAVVKVADHPRGNGALVFDLRVDPTPFLNMSAEEMAAQWRPANWTPETPRFPVKTLMFNRCPAIAPLSVLDSASIERIALRMDEVQKHAALLAAAPRTFSTALYKALQLLDEQQTAKYASSSASEGVDAALYDGFVGDADKSAMANVRSATASQIAGLQPSFADQRLQQLYPLYVMRNYPQQASDEQRQAWDEHLRQALLGGDEQSRMHKFFARLSELAGTELPPESQFVLEELQLYAQAIMPEPLES
jgi:exodeoxyribonuclease-1